MTSQGRGLCATLLLLSCLAAQAQPVVVVVNPRVSERLLPLNTVRGIFGMRMAQWSDGTPVRVFVLPDREPVHLRFSEKILRVLPHQLRRAWDRKVYSGMGQAPTEVGSVETMRQRIADTPGAIGYLPEEKIDDSVQTLDVQ